MTWWPKEVTLDDLYKSLWLANARYTMAQDASETITRRLSSDKKKKGVYLSVLKRLKFFSGVKGYQNRRDTKELNESTKKMHDAARKVTNLKIQILGLLLQELGEAKSNQLRETIGVFLGYLKDINQKNAAKEYQLTKGIDVGMERLKAQMVAVDMSTKQTAESAILVGALGTAAASGTPVLVTATVAQLAAASTGTSIASLHGVAATNATLAWLGGGSLATGGGGVATGTAMLGAITTAATGAVALLAAGCIASTHYSNTLTKATEYNKSVAIDCGNMEIAWTKMDGIEKRVTEMHEVMEQLAVRIKENFTYLAPLIPDFENRDPYSVQTFQSAAILVMAMSKLVDTPILGEDAALSSESVKIIQSTHRILNKELVNYD